MKAKAALISLLALFALALASCGGGDGTGAETGSSAATPGPPAEASPAEVEGEPPPRAVKVRIEGFAYHPDPVRVQTGGKVIWQNMDSAPHTATADDGSFDTGTLEEGKIMSETFKEPGVYTYHCRIHPTMHGTVEVVDKE